MCSFLLGEIDHNSSGFRHNQLVDGQDDVIESFISSLKHYYNTAKTKKKYLQCICKHSSKDSKQKSDCDQAIANIKGIKSTIYDWLKEMKKNQKKDDQNELLQRRVESLEIILSKLPENLKEEFNNLDRAHLRPNKILCRNHTDRFITEKKIIKENDTSHTNRITNRQEKNTIKTSLKIPKNDNVLTAYTVGSRLLFNSKVGNEQKKVELEMITKKEMDRLHVLGRNISKLIKMMKTLLYQKKEFDTKNVNNNQILPTQMIYIFSKVNELLFGQNIKVQ